jgi:hypothetical protein
MSMTMKTFRKKSSKRKVTLRDIVEPKPSRATTRVLNIALKRAHKDQTRVIEKAKSLQGA